MIITFDSPINRVAFEVRTQESNDFNLILSISNDEIMIGEALFSTGLEFRFVGIQCDTCFDRVTISNSGSGGGAQVIDNLRFESVATEGYTADINRYGDMTLADHAEMQSCMTGPGGGVVEGCDSSDLDLDDDVEMNDVALFRWLFDPPIAIGDT